MAVFCTLYIDFTGITSMFHGGVQPFDGIFRCHDASCAVGDNAHRGFTVKNLMVEKTQKDGNREHQEEYGYHNQQFPMVAGLPGTFRPGGG